MDDLFIADLQWLFQDEDNSLSATSESNSGDSDLSSQGNPEDFALAADYQRLLKEQAAKFLLAERVYKQKIEELQQGAYEKYSEGYKNGMNQSLDEQNYRKLEKLNQELFQQYQELRSRHYKRTTELENELETMDEERKALRIERDELLEKLEIAEENSANNLLHQMEIDELNKKIHRLKRQVVKTNILLESVNKENKNLKRAIIKVKESVEDLLHRVQEQDEEEF